MPDDRATADRLRRLLAGRGAVEEKRLMGTLGFMVDGHLCCGVAPGRLMVRVGPGALAAALREPHARPMAMKGRALGAFLYVDEPGYRTDAELQAWVERGLAFVRTLPAR